MITAKDDFMFDREMMQDLVSLANQAGLNNEEMAKEFEGIETIKQYEELQQRLIQMQVCELERIRRGETLLQHQINKAVMQAAKNDK